MCFENALNTFYILLVFAYFPAKMLRIRLVFLLGFAFFRTIILYVHLLKVLTSFSGTQSGAITLFTRGHIMVALEKTGYGAQNV